MSASIASIASIGFVGFIGFLLINDSTTQPFNYSTPRFHFMGKGKYLFSKKIRKFFKKTLDILSLNHYR